ncbi:efflux RND transporter permease subunit [Halocynthiibacter sp.]|uniref:efflux RND transporter permease subunit n=1 Tax=Halocynthiibacter sp. TaxID=1979210 RepID=UPI003C600995
MSRARGILSYFTRHRTAANLLLVMMIALGIAALPKMRTQFFPDVIVEGITVSAIWKGAGAEDIDSAIVQVLEPALLSVDGVTSSEASSREGSASIWLEFEPGQDMGRASDDVQLAVDAITNLPEDAEDVNVRRGNWRDRVTDVVITGPVGVAQLGRFADELVTRLFAAGVTRSTIRGIAAGEIVVEVPMQSMIRHDVTMEQISRAIAGEVNSDPAGDVTGTNTRVRTGTATRSVDQIEAIVLRVNDDGSRLTINDVARISRGGIDRERAYFVGEDPAISVRVDRSGQGDAIEVQRDVERVASELREVLPESVSVDLIRTRAEAISGRLNILLDNGLMGLGLVLLLLFLFLNARIAFWVAAGIPVAMLATIALMYIFGLTINMVSLFALIITLGIVVDDAIVVGEHADFRARRLGESANAAAENAAIRMSAPVFSATITTIIAFFGLVAVGGRFGDLISDIPFTVVAVLMASLMECFLILPNHMAHALTHSAKEHWYDWPNRQVNKGFRWLREAAFRPLMHWVVRARYAVLAGAVFLLATQAAVFIRGDVQWRFFNGPERSSIYGNFAMAPGATRDDSFEMMRELQRAADAVGKRYAGEYGTWPMTYALAEVGGNTGRGLSGTDAKTPDQLGSIAIELIDADLRPWSAFKFVADMQDEVRNHPRAETVSFRGSRSGPGGDSLYVEFFGADADTLKAASEALKTALQHYPEVSALEDNLAYDKEELILELTPQGQALGFTIDGLGRVLRNRLGGIEAATYPDGPRSAAIRVELPVDELTADFLERTHMRTPGGEYVPLSDIVTVESRKGFSTVRRENGIRLIAVTGDISEDDPTRAAEINEILRSEILPDIESDHQVAFRIAGLAEQEQEFLSDAFLGFSLCMIGIYLTLAWIFASWMRPAVVLAIVPFGLIGTIFGHVSWEVPLSMFSVVGLIGMTGIIINDSIVLVTTVEEYSENRDRISAIIDATCDRLRAVMLTTLTTVLGLAPLLFERSVQAEFLKPTVITLVYGLGFGMILVLLVVPALLAMQLDLKRQFTALKRGLRRPGTKLQPILLGCGAVLAGAFLLSFGSVAVTGSLPSFLPMFTGSASSSALLIFTGISAVVLITTRLIVGWRNQP